MAFFKEYLIRNLSRERSVHTFTIECEGARRSLVMRKPISYGMNLITNIQHAVYIFRAWIIKKEKS
jgi:hypothetical protein